MYCSQIGFLENYRTTDHIFSLKTLLNKYTRDVRNGKVYLCFIDFRKHMTQYGMRECVPN